MREARYRARLAPVVDYVRENLTRDLSVEHLARVAHFSPYHFHRVFTAVMGETVGTFVRRARLERAIALMRSVPDRSLGSVALQAGFTSLSDFSRSFRRHFGCAPSTWDRRTPLTFLGAEEGDEASPYDLDSMVRGDDGPPVAVQLRETPTWRVAFVRIRRPFEEGALEAGYHRLRSWVEALGLPRKELLGFSWDDVEITPPDQIRYDFACTVPPGVEGGEGVVVRDVPPLVVATAHARGGLPRVARAWHHLYHDWLPASRFEPYHLPPFEWYRSWPETLDWDAWDLDCCIPLKALRE